ncbi:hypothetical protein EHO60_13710 [Leptospira fletcheri]|uniref:Uncharacterized protein n=1 Tax=Leptospira fletcheri TaxID=2484981 RepID=A0A4V6QKP7_9LEPT|nr:hypothetical protein [Leptospira fletcheri]TGK09069.1 hypothetical protein EHO60_13710 [Leptospira fletcheri]
MKSGEIDFFKNENHFSDRVEAFRKRYEKLDNEGRIQEKKRLMTKLVLLNRQFEKRDSYLKMLSRKGQELKAKLKIARLWDLS